MLFRQFFPWTLGLVFEDLSTINGIPSFFILILILKRCLPPNGEVKGVPLAPPDVAVFLESFGKRADVLLRGHSLRYERPFA